MLLRHGQTCWHLSLVLRLVNKQPKCLLVNHQHASWHDGTLRLFKCTLWQKSDSSSCELSTSAWQARLSIDMWDFICKALDIKGINVRLLNVCRETDMLNMWGSPCLTYIRIDSRVRPSLSVTPGKGYTVNKLFMWGQLHSTHCFGQEIPLVCPSHAVSSRNCQKSSVVTPDDPRENPSVGNTKETIKTPGGGSTRL